MSTSPASGVTDSIPSVISDRGKLCFILATSGMTWAGATLILNNAWYKNYPRSSFHFYNDWGEWYNMDKTGHLVSSYSISMAGIYLMKQTGMEQKKAAWTGGLYGPVLLSTIELLDGFSKKWGFSVPDMASNIAGSALAVSQEILTGHQVVRLKYSYHESGLAEYRPDALGRNLPEKMLKDYNGQTHWLSININSLIINHNILPEWLNIAFGYSANGMLGGHSNPSVINGMELPDKERQRQFYLSPDIDISKLNTGSETLNYLLRSLNFLKFPAPAVEYNNKEGFRFYLVFF